MKRMIVKAGDLIKLKMKRDQGTHPPFFLLLPSPFIPPLLLPSLYVPPLLLSTFFETKKNTKLKLNKCILTISFYFVWYFCENLLFI